MSTPSTHPFPATMNEARRALVGAYATVRSHVRRVGDAAGRTLDRVGTAAETYVGAKIKRRVKPPIVVALIVAGVALVVALVAAFRR